MVGPTTTDEARRSANAKLKVGFVLLVGFSPGLVVLQAGGSLTQVSAAVGAGLVVGLALTWYLAHSLRRIHLGG